MYQVVYVILEIKAITTMYFVWKSRLKQKQNLRICIYIFFIDSNVLQTHKPFDSQFYRVFITNSYWIRLNMKL